MSDCASCTNPSITADCTVNAAIASTPAAGAVLASFGIDTCCGGGATIGVATTAARADLATVLEALASVQHEPAPNDARTVRQPPSCGCGCR